MKQIKSVNIFTQGDSTEPSTWSNVPFCFTNALENTGIQINRINILPENNYLFKLYRKIWNRLISKVIDLFFKNSFYSIDRSLIYRAFVRTKIKKAIKLYSSVDCNIFLTFSYTNKFSTTPSLLICDYTYEIYIKDILKREPNLIEDTYIKYEKKIINRSNIVVNLFSNYASYMSSRYNKKVSYVGNMGVNVVLQKTIEKVDTLILKEKSNYLLFIGNRWNKSYVFAAKLLIEAFLLLRAFYPQMELHIIGMNNDSFEVIPLGVECHGYLDKNNIEQREKYYELLLNAKIFINTSGSYGATMEAMYYYTPIITAQYSEFVEEFGEEINFGQYCRNMNKEDLLQCIITILNATDYNRMCALAHDVIAPHTWEQFSLEIVNLIESNIN